MYYDLGKFPFRDPPRAWDLKKLRLQDPVRAISSPWIEIKFSTIDDLLVVELKFWWKRVLLVWNGIFSWKDLFRNKIKFLTSGHFLATKKHFLCRGCTFQWNKNLEGKEPHTIKLNFYGKGDSFIVESRFQSKDVRLQRNWIFNKRGPCWLESNLQHKGTSLLWDGIISVPKFESNNERRSWKNVLKNFSHYLSKDGLLFYRSFRGMMRKKKNRNYELKFSWGQFHYSRSLPGSNNQWNTYALGSGYKKFGNNVTLISIMQSLITGNVGIM